MQLADKKSEPKTVLITGASGFVGQRLIADLLAQTELQIIATARSRPAGLAEHERLHYLKADIRDARVAASCADYGVNVVVHLAAVVEPPASMTRAEQYAIDVTATEQLYQAALAAGVEQFILCSSGAAYGYHADNPVPLRETDALRGNPAFAYSDHKRIIEEKFAAYRQAKPAMQQLIFRPGLILGEVVDNQITRLFQQAVIVGVTGTDTPFGIIWVSDVSAAIVQGIEKGNSGIYNLSGDGVVTLPDIAKKLAKPFLRLPGFALRSGLAVASRLGWSRYGPEQVDFIRYRPVLNNEALKAEFPGLPRYDSATCLQRYLDHC